MSQGKILSDQSELLKKAVGVIGHVGESVEAMSDNQKATNSLLKELIEITKSSGTRERGNHPCQFLACASAWKRFASIFSAKPHVAVAGANFSGQIREPLHRR